MHAQDYDLASFQSGAIVDRGTTGFAHVAIYRNGNFEMEQERYVVGPGAVVGVRASLLPGSRVEAGGSVGALELSMKPMAGMGGLDL